MSINDKLLQICINNQIECKFIPKRSHAIIGVPIMVENSMHRLYIRQKDKDIVITITLGNVSQFEFPAFAYQEFQRQQANGIEQQPQPQEEQQQEKPQVEEEQDFDLGLADFIASYHYEKLSDSELIEKVSMLKNETLKANWIKQIKDRSKKGK